MPDNDKKGNIFFSWKINWGNGNKRMQEIGNSHAKRTGYAMPTLSGNWSTQPHDNGILLTQLVQPQSRA